MATPSTLNKSKLSALSVLAQKYAEGLSKKTAAASAAQKPKTLTQAAQTKE